MGDPAGSENIVGEALREVMPYRSFAWQNQG